MSRRWDRTRRPCVLMTWHPSRQDIAGHHADRRSTLVNFLFVQRHHRTHFLRKRSRRLLLGLVVVGDVGAIVLDVSFLPIRYVDRRVFCGLRPPSVFASFAMIVVVFFFFFLLLDARRLICKPRASLLAGNFGTERAGHDITVQRPLMKGRRLLSTKRTDKHAGPLLVGVAREKTAHGSRVSRSRFYSQ